MRNWNGDRVMATPSVVYGDEAAVAAVNGGEGGTLLVRKDGVVWDDGDRQVWAWKILGTDFEEIGSGDDIKSPIKTKPLEAMGSLISFLTACAESRSEESENYTLFPQPVREWAELYSDELNMIAVEIDEEGENV